jgi:preprotein translocase subunit SecG
MNLFWILIAAHVVLCVFLVLLVLVQNDKGGGLAGALTGGSSNAAFSGTGAASAISTLTRYVAIIFMVVILGINYVVSSSDVNAPSEQNLNARKELSNVLAPSQPAKQTAPMIISDQPEQSAPTQ